MIKRIACSILALFLCFTMFAGIGYADEQEEITIAAPAYNSADGTVTVSGASTLQQIVIQLWKPNDGGMQAFVSQSVSDGKYSATLTTGSLPEGTYTVKVANYFGGSYYTSTFEVKLSGVKDITAFTVSGQNGSSSIDSINHTVTFHVPSGTSVAALAPTIAISADAKITPLSGVEKDFTSPVSYTVTAQNGTEQVWTVTCIIDSVSVGGGGTPGGGAPSGGTPGGGAPSGGVPSGGVPSGGSQSSGSQGSSPSGSGNTAGTSDSTNKNADGDIKGGASSNQSTDQTQKETSSKDVPIIASTPKLNEDTGTAAVEISSFDLNSAFEQASDSQNDEKTVAVDIPKVDGADTYEATLPINIFKPDESKKAIEIKTDIAEITLPTNMLSSLNTGNANSVSLNVTMGDTAKLSPSVQAQIGSRPVIELQLKVDGNQTSWNNENVPVTVTIPYKPTEEELKDPEHLTVWYIDGSGNAVPVTTGRYDPETGTITFTTTHFSKYAVVYVNKTFKDLDKVPWANKEIGVMASKGIIQGLTDTEFGPNENVTRGDFTGMLVRALGLSAKYDSCFDDIKPGDPNYKEIAIAKKLGISNGAGNNKFKPGTLLTRQDMIVLTDRALRTLKKISGTPSVSCLDKYSDKGQIPSGVISSVASLIDQGLIQGSGGKLNIKANLTRVSTAVFLYRVYNKYL